MNRSLLLLLLGLILGQVGPAVAREPNSLEQFYLELVNRARAHPAGEVTRLSGLVWGDTGSPAAPDLNEGLPPATISPAAKPPLAFDPRLIDAASDYSDFLLATQQFDHEASGNPATRMTAAGYVFNPPSGAGENLAITASSGPHPINADRVEEHHAGLFVDGDVAGRGHRLNILDNNFREVGIAIRADSNGISYFPGSFNDVLSTQNFAMSADRIFVTGVIYHDLNSNIFYDPGESAGTLALTVKNSGGGTVASGTSFASGGYSINLGGIPAGTYTLFARTALDEEDSVAFFWDGVTNVKADLVDPNFLFVPPVAPVFRPDLRIGPGAAAATGNDLYSNNATGQAPRRASTRPIPMVWHVRVENDGNEIDSIRIGGSRGNRLFRIDYQQRQGAALANVTASILAGRVQTLPSGLSESYQITTRLKRPALGRRGSLSFFLRASSTNDPARIDRVNGIVLNRTRKPGR